MDDFWVQMMFFLCQKMDHTEQKNGQAVNMWPYWNSIIETSFQLNLNF